MKGLVSVKGAAWSPQRGVDARPSPPISLLISNETKIVWIRGSNGAGKTTLLRMISGEIVPSVGEVHWSIDPIQSVGCLFQARGLLSEVSVKGNLLATGQKKLIVECVLENFGLSHISSRVAKHLSGGEERRVQFARLVLMDRSIWLLDEPTSGIDMVAADKFREEIKMAVCRGRTAVIVSHDVSWVDAVISDSQAGECQTVWVG